MHSSAGIDLNSVALLTAIALGCGFALIRIRQPAIVGYILAGVVLGPSGLALVGDSAGINLFAEMGVLLLLFIVGMELSLATFRTIYRIALLCALLQSAIAIGATFLFGWVLGWPFETSLVIGFVLSLSSTAVGIKMLEDIGELRTHTGRTTIGVLIAQDLLIIPMLLITQSLGVRAPEGGIDWTLVIKLAAAIAILAGVAIILTRRGRIQLPWSRYLKGHPDVAPLAAIAFCFVFAAISGYAGFSPSYGAFLAGLIMGASTDRRAAIHFTHPVQSILLMIFFLSIGLLIDLQFIFDNLGTILFFVFVVLVAKTLANIVILNALGEPWDRAFLAGVVMAQIGEFSFVIAASGRSNGVIDADAYQIALSVIALSLTVSPFWMATARRFQSLGRAPVGSLAATFEKIYPRAYRLSREGARRVVESAEKAPDRMGALADRLRRRKQGPGDPPAPPSEEPPATDLDPGPEPKPGGPQG